MKNWIGALFFATSILSAPLAVAEKVVVVDVQQAVAGTDAVQKAVKELKANPEFASLMAKADSIKAEMQRISEDANTNGSTWSEEKKAEARKKMEYKKADLQLAGKKLQAEEQAALQKVMKDMGPKVDSALKQIISAEGITLVLNAKAAVYSAPAHNITAKLTERLNKDK